MFDLFRLCWFSWFQPDLLFYETIIAHRFRCKTKLRGGLGSGIKLGLDWREGRKEDWVGGREDWVGGK